MNQHIMDRRPVTRMLELAFQLMSKLWVPLKFSRREGVHPLINLNLARGTLKSGSGLSKSLLLPKPLEQLSSVADYQFGRGAGPALTQGKIHIEYSRRTGRVRFLYDEKGELLATLRAKDGYLALTQEGGLRLLRAFKSPKLRVVVQSNVGEFIRQGRNVFAKHVVVADEEIRPEGEVLIVDEKDALLGVGKAVLTGREMTAFKTGAAIKTRHGIDE